MRADRPRMRGPRRSILDRKGLAAGLLALLAGAVVVVLTLIGWPASEYRSGDFFQFWAGGHALLASADPYDLQWWTRFHLASGSREIFEAPQPAGGPAWTTAYPLWTLMIAVPFAVLPFALAAALWLVTQLAAVAIALAALAKTVLRTEPRRDTVVLIGIAVGFQPLWLLVVGGNITGFIFAALAGTVALSRRPLTAGALLGALALKPQSVLVGAMAVVGMAPWTARRRMVVSATVIVLALVVASLALRPGWVAGWSRSLLALQGSTGSNATLWTLGRLTGVTILSVLAPLALFVFLVAWVLVRRPRRLLLIGAAVPVSIAVSPHGWSYDQLHLLITVAVIIELLSAASATARITGLAGLVVVAVAVPWLLYALAFARGNEDFSALIPPLLLGFLVAVDHLVQGNRLSPLDVVPEASATRS